MKINKTNAMRALDSAALPYAVHAYPHGKEAVDGAEVARLLGQDPDAVFKTLITQANTGEYLVFMLPVNAVLDLKKAAKAAGSQAYRDDPCQRHHQGQRICARRMLSSGDEEDLPHLHRRERPAL